MIDFKKLEGIFSQEEINKFRQMDQNRDSLSWDEKQKLTLLDGYPDDTNSEDFKKADKLNILGWECHKEGLYEKALIYYDKAIKSCYDFPMVWNNKGLSHFRSNDFEQAQNAYLEAININPMFIKPYSNLGILYFELKKDKKEAAKWLKKALAIDPDYQRAKQYLDQCEVRGPDEPDTRNNKIYLEIIDQLQNGFLAKAMKLVEDNKLKINVQIRDEAVQACILSLKKQFHWIIPVFVKTFGICDDPRLTQLAVRIIALSLQHGQPLIAELAARTFHIELDDNIKSIIETEQANMIKSIQNAGMIVVYDDSYEYKFTI